MDLHETSLLATFKTASTYGVKYKNAPAKFAEWIIASHVEKHTPAKRTEPTIAPRPSA